MTSAADSHGPGAWKGPLAKGQNSPFGSGSRLLSEQAGQRGSYFYLEENEKLGRYGLAVAINPGTLSPLPPERAAERLSGLFQMDDREHCAAPLGKTEYKAWWLFAYKANEGGGILYPSGVAARPISLSFPQLMGLVVQLALAGTELRASGLGIGRPGPWAVYIEPNRRIKLVGAGLRWALEGEESLERDDVAAVMEFLSSFMPAKREAESESQAALRALLGGQVESFQELVQASVELYHKAFGVTYAVSQEKEHQGFDDLLTRAIGVANIGRMDESVAAFEKLKARIPEAEDDEAILRFWTNYAAILVAKGEARRALELLDDAGIREDSGGWRYRAWAYNQLGAIPKADEAYKRAYELDPQNRDLLLDYGWFCYARSLRDSFEELVPRLLRDLGQEDPDLWLLIGDFYAARYPDVEESVRVGKLLAARDAYQTALGAGGDELILGIKIAALDIRLGAPEALASLQAIRSRMEKDGGEGQNWNALGNGFSSVKEWASAVECFSRASTENPGDAVIAGNLISELNDSGKPEKAVRFAEAWLSEPGRKPTADFLNHAGNSYYFLENYGEAVRRIREALALDPGHPVYSSNYLAALDLSGDTEGAAAFGAECLATAMSPTAAFWSFLGLAYGKLGKDERAADAYRESLALEPNDATRAASLIAILERMGRSEEARRLMDEWDSSRPAVVRSTLWNNLGMEHYRQGRFAEALPLFLRALKAEPGESICASNAVASAREAGETDEALRLGEEWLAAHADDATATFFNSLGRAYQTAGRPADAAPQYRAASEGAPSDPDYAYNLISTLRGLGRHGEAIDFALPWMEAYPSNATTSIRNEVGLALFSLARFDDGAEQFRAAMDGDGQSPVYVCNYANSLKMLGRTDEALAFGEAWLGDEKHQANADLLTFLGGIYYSAGAFADAARSFRGALKLSPDCAQVFANLVASLAQTGSDDEIKSTIREWLLVPGREIRDSVWNFLGNIYFNQKEFGGAAIFYRKALELDGSEVVYAQNLAVTLIMGGDMDAAIAEGEAWLGAEGHIPSGDFLNALGTAHFRKDGFAAAAGYFGLAAERLPANPSVGGNYIEALCKAGRASEASLFGAEWLEHNQADDYFMEKYKEALALR